MVNSSVVPPSRGGIVMPPVGAVAFYLACVFLTLAVLTGGGSRFDVSSHLIIRPAAVLAAAAAVMMYVRSRDRVAWDILRAPLAFLLGLAGIMLVQLIPLPPALWMQLPGRELTAQGAEILGVDQPWRPISLSPARTWNSLVSLLPPLAMLLLGAMIPARRNVTLLTVLIVLLTATAVLGLAQRAGPEGGALYFYHVTNASSAVGFFANRNHQAVMLASTVPMLATFAQLGHLSAGRTTPRTWIAAVGAVSLVPLLLVTESRAGLLLLLVGALGSIPLLRFSKGQQPGPSARRRRLILYFLVAAAASALVALTIISGQGSAIARLATEELSADLRIQLLDTYFLMVAAHFPAGVGFGAFEPVFQAFEPNTTLDPAFVNNAHNDLMQIIIEAGFAGAALVAGFLVWFARRAVRVWRSEARGGASVILARLSTIIITLLLLASLVDYPLRTPFVMVVFALATIWLNSAHGSAERPPTTGGTQNG